MIKNYFKIAFRSLFRNRLYSLINISGLTLGIAFSSLLALYVLDELSYDSMHRNVDNIYRVVITDDSGGDIRHYGSTQGSLGPELKKTFPEVANAARLWKYTGQITFIHNGQRFGERGWYMADDQFFNFFDFELISGDKASALSVPLSIILTESTARKYFGDSDPIGQTLHENRMGELIVTGVLKDLPPNSHLQFNMLVSMDEIDENWESYLNNWNRLGTYTYLMLNDDMIPDKLTEKFPSFLSGKMGEESSSLAMYLQSLRDVHFYSAGIEDGTDENKGELKYIFIFVAIGLFILLIAAINYVNLATARAMKRAREIGVRKVSGAQRKQLIFQFLSESTLIALISFFLAIGLVDLLMPSFQSVTQKDGIGTSFVEVLAIQFIITIVIGFLSGIYPALYLSNLKPTIVLKGLSNQGKSGELFRRILVIAQFALSIFMIISTIVVYHQLDFIKQMDLGFNKDQIIVVDINHGNVRRKFETMKTEFLKHPNVFQVAASSRVPGEWKNITEIYIKNVLSPSDSLSSYYMCFDEDMISTYDFTLTTGSNFSGYRSVDSTHVLLNESAVRLLGIPDDPIGSKLRITRRPEMEFTVIGVLKDFNFQSLHSEISPLLIGYWNAPIRSIDYFSVRVSDVDMAKTIDYLTEVHEQFDNGTPIEYHFLDSQIELFYQNEQRAGKIFLFGAFLVIFIACLGLFGLVSFMVQKRTKEIGIRKVLGASSGGLYLLISTSFLKQIVVAWLIAAPLAYLAMTSWLSLFTYNPGFNPLIIVVAGVAAIIVAMITVSYRSVSASFTNPAKTLKYE